MQMLVTVTILNTIALDDDKRARGVVGPGIGNIMQAGKVQAAGFLTNKRGAFFLMEVSEAADLYEILGPEIYSTCQVEAQPVMPLEKGAELFEKWAAAGR